MISRLRNSGRIQIAPVIVARLRALAGENASSDTAFLMATTRYNSWKAQNPSCMERLRSTDEKLKTVEAPIRAKHRQMREYFKWGRDAYGQRI